MADQPKASGVPKVVSYEDFNVLNGKGGLSREVYKESTFHTSDKEEGDPQFRLKAELMETTGADILGQEEKLETDAEKAKESATLAQVKQAAL
jgi:hypothetical protein